MTPTDERGKARPTSRQLSYLRALAQRTGQTFAWPQSRSEASREIRRLKQVAPSTRAERALERDDYASEADARAANCDVPIGVDELRGYGSSATWRRS